MTTSEPGGARVPADPERLAEAEAFTRGAVEYDATGALALFVAEYDRRGSEIERLRGLWPKNGLGEDTNVHQLVANHRAWSKRAWEAQSAAETERDALRADVERLRARTHEIQAQEMAKRADPGSEALGALNVAFPAQPAGAAPAAVIAAALHLELEQYDAGCEGHPPHRFLKQPECERMAAAVVAALEGGRGVPTTPARTEKEGDDCG